MPKSELGKLRQFLESPYFNNFSFYVKLYDELILYYPDFSAVNKVAVFKKLLPAQDLPPSLINERFSQLSSLVKQFFVQQELKNNLFLSQSLQMASAQARGLPKWFLKTYHKSNQYYEKQHPSSSQNTFALWSSYDMLQNYLDASQLEKNPPNINHRLKFLDEYYCIQKLKHACNITAYSKFYEQEIPEIFFLEDILNAAQNDFKYHPIIQLYHQIYRLFSDSERSDEKFEITSKLFFDFYNKLEDSDQFFILISLINYSMNRINDGHTSYITKVFELYQFGIEDDLFRQKTKLTETTFLNICTYGAYLKQFSWTDQFIETHKDLLKGKDQLQATQLAQAILSFHGSHFEDASMKLHNIKATSTARKLRIRSLHVRCLLELHLKNPSYYKTLISNVQSFRLFIYRNKSLSESVKKGYLNMIDAILKIADLRLYDWNKQDKKHQIITWIKTKKPLTTKAWLLNKLE